MKSFLLQLTALVDNGTMRLKHLSIGVGLCLAVSLIAQTPIDWQKLNEFPNIDLSKLSALQKPVALTILKEAPCSCGCGMKIAECRVKDPRCTYSRALAELALKSVAAGKSPAEVHKILETSKIAPPPPPPLLEDPIAISINGAPSKGP